MSVLESIGAAMPGVGFVLGGLIAADSRAAGDVSRRRHRGSRDRCRWSTPIAWGTKWPADATPEPTGDLDASDEVVVELIPGEMPTSESD